MKASKFWSVCFGLVLALMAACQVNAAENIAMVSEVSGKVTIKINGVATPAISLASIPLGAKVDLPAGSNLSVIYIATGDEFKLTGPGAYQLDPTSLKTISGASPVRQTSFKDPASGKIVNASLTSKAEITLRGVTNAAHSLEPLTPEGVIAVAEPLQLHWREPATGLSYRVQLLDSQNKLLVDQAMMVNSYTLSEDIPLTKGGDYVWNITTTLPDGSLITSSAPLKVASVNVRDSSSRAGQDKNSPVLWESALSKGIALRQRGEIQKSIDSLRLAKHVANSELKKMQATGELGVSLFQARRLDQAESSLRDAYAYFSGAERARYAIDLGNLAVFLKRPKDAQAFYEEALQLTDAHVEIHATAGLALARLASKAEKLKILSDLFQEIGRVDNPAGRIPLYLDLGEQAQTLGTQALELAYRSLEQARQLAAPLKPANTLLYAKVLDALAQLYEDQGRNEEALLLTQQALEQIHTLAAGSAGEALITLEWRQGRLQKALHHDDLALAAYLRAVDQIEIIRQDIPIDYEDGRSSFSSTLSPIFTGLTGLLLQQSEKDFGAEKSAALRRAVDTVELTKQSELQDYLGDRCIVDGVKGGSATVIPEGTAILYPVIFSDRVELLVETQSGIVRYSSNIAGAIVRQTAVGFAEALRNGADGYLLSAQQLYDWLLRPIEGFTAEQHIHALVIVPDGALRLIPLGALHDGKQFAIEKYAISTVTGLSMTNTNQPPAHGLGLLVAGVSEPGPVVDKLSLSAVNQIFNTDPANNQAGRGLARSRSLRSLRSVSVPALDAFNNDRLSRSAALSKALALPGVKQEIDAISQIMPGTSLLNTTFTVGDFLHDAESGSYRIMHIASHGVFGGSADTSYILAYDDLLTLDGLQSMLKSESFRKNPIELLSLSACETAEGDDRSPLGISGAAMKARAKSVLGTLWPVDDNAARKTMESFYRGIAKNHLSKTESLRQAQIELLHNEEFSHPLFWGPFVLIGNWL